MGGEPFSESQIKILERFVTNTKDSVFVLKNLPEVIKGALFSRYSRSTLGLRSLLLKEFILNQETAFTQIAGTYGEDGVEQQSVAIQKAQNFYDRILDGYGDDSIGELGGAHLAVEHVSMLAAKAIEDARIGGSPLEKSTRYIYFDQKTGGEYLFYREPVLMTSAHKDLYQDTCNALFEAYTQLIPELTAQIEKGFEKDPSISDGAYKAALRAKVLDCLRGLLPAGTLTNMGVFGNGRFFEGLLQKLHTSQLTEMQEIGKKAYGELYKVVPSFVRRADPSHRHFLSLAEFHERTRKDLKTITDLALEARGEEEERGPWVKLIDADPDGVLKVVASLLFPYSQCSLEKLQSLCKEMDEEQISRVLEAACSWRDHRRHKSPRALEQAEFTFEILTDFGAYRDLHRHRMLTQERQLLSCKKGYFVPQEIVGTPMEEIYVKAMEKGKKAHETIAQDFPEEAQYVVPMGFNIRWYFHLNLRALQWLCELRSQPSGHPMYRWVAQEMAKQVSFKFPPFERFFRFVDFDGYDLGRLGSEIRIAEKMKTR